MPSACHCCIKSVQALCRPARPSICAGTSFAAPHATGIAVLVKQKYPRWSPARIKSAIMTSASQTQNFGKRIPGTPFQFGAGAINPTRALNPGLVRHPPERMCGQECTVGMCTRHTDTRHGKRACQQTRDCANGHVPPPAQVFDSGLQDWEDWLCGVGYPAASTNCETRCAGSDRCGCRNQTRGTACADSAQQELSADQRARVSSLTDGLGARPPPCAGATPSTLTWPPCQCPTSKAPRRCKEF